MVITGELLVSNDLLLNAADNTLTIHYFQKFIWRGYKIFLFYFRSPMRFLRGSLRNDHSKDEGKNEKFYENGKVLCKLLHIIIQLETCINIFSTGT